MLPSIPTEPAPERSASPGVEPSQVRVKRSITSDMFKTCRGLNIRPRRRDLSTCVCKSTATQRTPNSRRLCRSAVVDGKENHPRHHQCSALVGLAATAALARKISVPR